MKKSKTFSICKSLLKWNKIESFFKRLITGEKWITYNNNVRKRSGRSKIKLCKRQNQDWHQEKWCCVWDRKRIVYYKLLASSQTIDSNFYSTLEGLPQAIEKKRPELISRKSVVFHQWQCQTSHIFGDPLKIERTWLGNFDAFIL